MIHPIFITLFILLFIVSAWAALLSFFEKENRAGLIFSSLSLVIIGVVILSMTGTIPPMIELTITLLIGTTSLVMLLPLPATKHIHYDPPQENIDERITMFSRGKLKPGSTPYNTFYGLYPTYKQKDDKWRKKPGLASPESKYFKELAFTATKASFSLSDKLHKYNEPPINTISINNNTNKEIYSFIRHWLKILGASDTGSCKLEPYHWYSAGGYEPGYGKPPEKKDYYAISIVVPMDKKLIDTAPHAPTMIESANRYVDVGGIAIQLANFLAELGYHAKAHIDGNYDMVLPLVAADSGMGTIGRMGILMHPTLGPRCRLAVVSTNLELPDQFKHKPDKSMLAFCRICKKCARVCPSAAISKSDRTTIKGIERWKINQEACFSYWQHAGTDCARCISACPYSRENNLLHKFIRSGIRHNFIFRHTAAVLDDVFYGKKPGRKSLTELEQ
ncbi:MAG: 4Fe-4S dicluster domain-containing protein [Bacteroidales bacterium]